MHALIGLKLAPMLLCGYFLNGGIGTLTQPSAGQTGGSGPPSGTKFIVTQSGARLVTQGGAAITTHP